MPDWTYQPLRHVAGALLGVRRSRRMALRVLAGVGSLPAGGWAVARLLGHRHPPRHLAGTVAGVPVRSRLGAVVPPHVARDAVRALPLIGAGFVVVAPVRAADVPVVREAAAGRRVPVLVSTDDPATAAAVAPYADGVLGEEPFAGQAPGIRGGEDRSAGEPPAAHESAGGGSGAASAGGVAVDAATRVVVTRAPSIADAVRELADPRAAVLAAPSVLIDAGPGWFARVMEAATPTEPPERPGLDPRRWPGWCWGVLAGMCIAVAGLVAAAVALGPVLLWYDRAFLGTDVAGLHQVNHHLVPFVRHNRVSLAGAMVATGVLYAGLAGGGMRRGRPWARTAFTVSGCAGFAAVLYLFAHGYLEPLHLMLAGMVLPMFGAAVRRPDVPRWTVLPEGPEPERRRALTGQLLMVTTGAGLFAGGLVISIVGLTGIFVHSDLVYLGTAADALREANPRLMPYLAHDRAGLGGSLLAAGAAITLLALWGWRRGERWVWWSLAVAAVAGFGPALAAHAAIGYLDFWHLAPVLAGVALTAAALTLARAYLWGR